MDKLSQMSGTGQMSDEQKKRFYLQRQTEFDKYLVLSREQRRKIHQKDLDELGQRIEGIKRRFAVVRRYDCYDDDWRAVDQGILFLVETWESCFLILMNSEKKMETWRLELLIVNKDSITSPPISKLNAHFTAFENGLGVHGISFARLYHMEHFLKATVDLIEFKKKVQEKILKKKHQKGFFSSLWDGLTGGFGGSISSFSVAPPPPPPIRQKNLQQQRKRKGTVHVVDAKWKQFLKENAGMTEEDLEDDELIKNVLGVLKRKGWRNSKLFDDSDDSGDEDDDDVESSGQSTSQARKSLVGSVKKKQKPTVPPKRVRKPLPPHLRKRKQEKINKKILSKKESEINELRFRIQNLEREKSKDQGRIQRYQKHVNKLEKEIKVLAPPPNRPLPQRRHKTSPLPPRPKKEVKEEEIEGEEEEEGSSSSSQAVPGGAPPPPPPVSDFDTFLEIKEEQKRIRREERKKNYRPPPKETDESLMNVLARTIGERRKHMFMEDDPDQQRKTDVTTDW